MSLICSLDLVDGSRCPLAISLLDGVVLISLDWFRVSLAFDRDLSHAQTIGWEKLFEAGSLAEARNKGWLCSEGVCGG